MTHPQRRARAEHLVHTAPKLHATLVTDPRPEGPATTLRTAICAWAAVPDDATHHLVLQDDIELDANFARSVGNAIATMPDSALAFFTEWGSRTSNMVRVAALTGHRWVEVVDQYVPTQALVLPADIARGFAEYAAREGREADPDDETMARYLWSTGVPAYVCAPNLVEHLDLPSLVGNGTHGLRRSAWYDPRAGIPAGGPVTILDGLTTVPYFSWHNGRARCQVRDDPTDTQWRAEFAADVLANRGMIDHIDDAYFRCLPGLTELRRVVRDDLLRALWVLSVTLGVVAGECPPASQRSEAELARPALATLAPGGLRLFVNDTDFARVSDLMTALVMNGIQHGLDRTPLESSC
jgi:hypothetical protein